jgi:hypothetical protein
MESQEELFLTKEECIEWSQRNFDKLIDGSLGGNLLSKYSMIGRFFVTQETLDFLEMGIYASIDLTPTDPHAAQLKTVMDYLRAILLHSPFSVTLQETPQWTTWYDLEAWKNEKYEQPLEHYIQPSAKQFITYIEPERIKIIQNRLSTFGEHPTGMGKFTRTMFAQDLRRVMVPSS